jgi:large subunit ribosomal protein L4e
MAGKAKVNVYSLKGDVVRTADLPSVFATVFRPDVIKKAVVAEEANRRQPYGPFVGAGVRHAVSTWGKGRGVSRVQRLSQGQKGAESPNNVGGRRAFPPKVEKDYSLKVNRKERLLARYSALAALADDDRVRKRGHKFAEGVTVPVVLENGVEDLQSTADVLSALAALGLEADVGRAKDGKKVRPGKGKMRGRRFKSPRGILIVVSDKAAPLFKGARNLSGIEIVAPEQLNAGLLAPGGAAGRLAVFSEAALKKVGEWQ